MKKTLLTALLITGAVSAFAQGSASPGFVTWGNNLTGFKSLIYGPDPGNPSLSVTGNSALDTPTGSTVYNGPLLGASSGAAGSYTAAFFAGNGNAPSNALLLVVSTTFRTATGNAQPAGLFVGGTVTVPGTMAGTPGEFQIRVWNNKGGTITTWAAAEVAWLAGLTDAGVSSLTQIGTYGGTDSGGLPVTTPSATGWTSFNVTSLSVPEPASFALAGLGAAALMIFRRRK